MLLGEWKHYFDIDSLNSKSVWQLKLIKRKYHNLKYTYNNQGCGGTENDGFRFCDLVISRCVELLSNKHSS